MPFFLNDFPQRRRPGSRIDNDAAFPELRQQVADFLSFLFRGEYVWELIKQQIIRILSFYRTKLIYQFQHELLQNQSHLGGIFSFENIFHEPVKSLFELCRRGRAPIGNEGFFERLRGNRNFGKTHQGLLDRLHKVAVDLVRELSGRYERVQQLPLSWLEQGKVVLNHGILKVIQQGLGPTRVDLAQIRL
jgi:hypothetical protein